MPDIILEIVLFLSVVMPLFTQRKIFKHQTVSMSESDTAVNWFSFSFVLLTVLSEEELFSLVKTFHRSDVKVRTEEQKSCKQASEKSPSQSEVDQHSHLNVISQESFFIFLFFHFLQLLSISTKEKIRNCLVNAKVNHNIKQTKWQNNCRDAWNTTDDTVCLSLHPRHSVPHKLFLQSFSTRVAGTGG